MQEAMIQSLAESLARCGVKLSDVSNEKLTGPMDEKQLGNLLKLEESPPFRALCGLLISSIVGPSINTAHDMPFSKDLFSFLDGRGSFVQVKQGAVSVRNLQFRLDVLHFLVAGPFQNLHALVSFLATHTSCFQSTHHSTQHCTVQNLAFAFNP
jgi:hypothetical protein